MSDDKALHRLAQLHEVLSVFAEADLNAAASRALLFIAMSSSDYNSPMLPSVADIARATQMSPSSTSRLLSNLSERENPCISSDKGVRDNRSESFFLTKRGKDLAETALALLYEGEDDITIDPLDLSAYAKSKYIERNGRSALSLRSWEKVVVKTIAKSDEALYFDNRSASGKEVSESEALTTHEFANRSQALLFLCKNGLPLRSSQG